MERARSLMKYVVVATATLVVATAMAIGAIPAGDGTITGCYNNTGALRVIDSAQTCKASETTLTWSQRGPQGPIGPQGPKGDPGVGPEVRYLHLSAPLTTDNPPNVTTLTGGDIAGWGQLEATCMAAPQDFNGAPDAPHRMILLALRNGSGTQLASATLEEYTGSSHNTATPVGDFFMLADTQFNGPTTLPLVGGSGLSVVREADRKLAAFRVVQRMYEDHCEYDVSVMIEP